MKVMVIIVIGQAVEIFICVERIFIKVSRRYFNEGILIEWLAHWSLQNINPSLRSS